MTLRNCRGRSTETKRVLRHLAEATRSGTKVTDPILEKLRLCPDAFKVGEILGKAFDSLKYRQEEVIVGIESCHRPARSFLPSRDRTPDYGAYSTAQRNPAAVLFALG